MRNQFIAWNCVAIVVSLIMLAFPADSQACYNKPVAVPSYNAPNCQLVWCIGAVINFTGGMSYDTDEEGDSIEVYKWTFPGEEDPIYGATPSYQFNSVGDYVVSLEVQDDEGQWSESESITIHIYGVETYFVAEGGSDQNPGTYGSPFATIQHAVNRSCDGGEVVLMPGIYQQYVNTFWERSITLRSYSGDPADTFIDGNFDENNPGTVLHIDGEVTIKDVTITGGYSEYTGGGVFCSNSGCSGSPGTPAVLENCIILGNHASLGGGGIYNERDILRIKNCQFMENTSATGYAGGAILSSGTNQEFVVLSSLFKDNTAGIGGGMALAMGSEADVINCTFYGNQALDTDRGGALSSSNVTGHECTLNLKNSILWDNTPNEIDATYNNVWVSYSDIEGCGGSGSWNSNYGANQGGNIDTDPCFVETSTTLNPHLSNSSPCINVGDPYSRDELSSEVDMDGDPRVLYNCIDMGVDESAISDFPYLTSFEVSQGFNYETCAWGNDNSAIIDDWKLLNDYSASLSKGKYYYEKDKFHEYQYLYLYNGAILDRPFRYFYETNQIVRISCIPSSGGIISLLNGNTEIASIKFESDNYIYVWKYDCYQKTEQVYNVISGKCLDFLGNNNDPEMLGYSYENTWMEFEILMDWSNQTYSVKWSYCDPVTLEHTDIDLSIGSTTDFEFDDDVNVTYHQYTNIEFRNEFRLNRVSISDEILSGGVFGSPEDEDADIWIKLPISDPENPLKGRNPVIGSVWYSQLGEYKIKCCPSWLDDSDADNWMLIDSGGCTHIDSLLANWDAEGFYNGDYMLKVEVYNDLGVLMNSDPCEGVTTNSFYYNGQMQDDVPIRYPLIGKLKAKVYQYAPPKDITVNWPGSFPFEFQRYYSDSLKTTLYPLFFGWTHNHNIRLIENCTAGGWEKNTSDVPIGDGTGLGIGHIWLQNGLGCQLFVPADIDGANVTYILKENEFIYLEDQREYIIRQSSGTGTQTDVVYTYYLPDGRSMLFDPAAFSLDYALNPQGEGVVNWAVNKGITSQQDRFGNALNYTYNVTNDFQLEEIKTSVVGVDSSKSIKMLFAYEPAVIFGPNNPPSLLESIALQGDNGEGAEGIEVIEYDLQYSSVYNIVWYSIHKNGAYASDTYWYDIDDGTLELKSFDTNDYGGDPALEVMWLYHTYVLSRYGDGSLKEVGESEMQGEQSHIYLYEYTYNVFGNLITQITEGAKDDPYTFEEWPFPATLGLDAIYNKKIVETNSTGVMLKEKTLTYNVTKTGNVLMNPYSYDYLETTDYRSGHQYAFWHIGKGGVTNYEYLYEDERFPLKPTTILEYLDEAGDGQEEDIEFYRKTTLQYDDYGNTIEKRVYVDEARYVLTTMDYHSQYNFPIRQTTWKELCQNDTASGDRVEKLWLYGASDGTVSNGGVGDEGNYLIKEKQLLVDDATPANQVWKETFIDEYQSNGQPLIIWDPEINKTTLQYDDYSFLEARQIGDTPTVTVNRYLYDSLGRKCLEGDAQGKVVRYDHDNRGNVLNEKKYNDPCAMIRSNFDLSFYAPVNNQDWYESLVCYGYYDRSERPQWTCFPICENYEYGQVKLSYNEKGGLNSKHYQEYPENNNFYEWEEYYTTNEGVLCGEWHHIRNTPIDNHSMLFFNWNYLDGMSRCTNAYEFNYSMDSTGVSEYCSNPSIKHTETDYYPTGKKKSEKIYKVSREGSYPITYTPILERHEEYEYNALEQLIKTIEDPDTLAIVTQYGYDVVGNQIYVVDPSGHVIFKDYDCAGRVIREYFAVEPVLSSTYIQDAPMVGSNYINLAATKANAHKSADYIYDNNDQVEAVTRYDDDGSTILAHTELDYDERGRIEEVREDIDGVNNPATTQYAYYDAGPSVNYHTVVTDPCSQVTSIALNYDGKTTKVLYPSDDYEEISYYGFGLPYQKTVFNNLGQPQTITYEYTKWGNIKKITYPDNGYLYYNYFGRNMLYTIEDHRLTQDRPGDPQAVYSLWEFEFDPSAKQLMSYIDPDGHRIFYDYNAAYNRKSGIRVEDAAETTIYDVQYDFDLAGRMTNLTEMGSVITGMEYDANGNRSAMEYYLFDEGPGGYSFRIDYEHDINNRLRKFNTTDGPTFSFGGDVGPSSDWADIDGLGRLVDAEESLSHSGVVGGVATHDLNFSYDRRSQLTDAAFTGIGGGNWESSYLYAANGNMICMDDSNLYYDGHLLTQYDSTTIDWNLNGNLAQIANGQYIAKSFDWNWDKLLRSATVGDDVVSCKYDPSGARVYRQHYDGENTTAVKYIVDPVGDYPTVLMELDAQTLVPQHWFVHANGQTLAQCDLVVQPPFSMRDRFFLLHDRLGSVRLAVDESAAVKATYTYDPFGNSLENQVAAGFDTPYRFANYWWDEVVGQYYCNARWYDPELARFTGRDPVRGTFKEPLTLHAYLYCLNDPMNRVDPSGMFSLVELMNSMRDGLQRNATMGQLGGSIKNAISAFVQRLNLMAELKDLALVGRDAWQVAKGIGHISKVFGSYASGAARVGVNGAKIWGWRALSMTSNAVLYSESILPGGTLDFFACALGDPHPPLTPHGLAGSILHSIWDEYFED